MILKRRETILIAGAAAIGTDLIGADQNTPQLVSLERKQENLTLRGLATEQTGFYAVWRTHPVKGDAYLAYHAANGKEVWRRSLGGVQVPQIFSRKPNTVTIAHQNPQDFSLQLTDFNSQGVEQASPPLPRSKSFSSFSGNEDSYFALDSAFNILSADNNDNTWKESFSGISAPSMGGHTPTHLAGSIHCVDGKVAVLDHITGRLGYGYPPNTLQIMEPANDRIAALRSRNLSKVQANLADAAHGLALKVPLTFYMATSGSIAAIFGFFQPNGAKVSLARFSPQAQQVQVADLAIPSEPSLRATVPLLAAATKDHVLVAYNTGTILKYSLANLANGSGWS